MIVCPKCARTVQDWEIWPKSPKSPRPVATISIVCPCGVRSQWEVELINRPFPPLAPVDRSEV